MNVHASRSPHHGAPARRSLRRGALGAAIAVVTLAAGTALSLSAAYAGEPDDDTVVKIRTAKGGSTTVLHMPDMRVGETRTIDDENGKPVDVTRTEDGYSLKVNGKTIDVALHGAPGHVFITAPGGKGVDTESFVTGDGVKKVVVMKHGFAFNTDGDETIQASSAAELLDKSGLKSLEGADRRTKETVARALEELMEKRLVFAPALDAGRDGDHVEVRVLRHKDDEAK